MNFRLTAILFATIFVLGLVLLILSLSSDKDVSTDALMQELVAVKPENIDVVEMDREDGSKLTLRRTGKDRWEEEWEVPLPGGAKQPTKAKADPFAVGELIGALLKVKPTACPELRTNPAVHGLQPPGLKVTLRQGNERSSTINFGDVSLGGKYVFVTTSSQPERPMAILRSAVEPLFRTPGGSGKAVDLAKWASDFRVKSVFAADLRGSGDDVNAITLSAKGKSLTLNKVGGVWMFGTTGATAGWGEADAVGDVAATPGTFTGVRPLLGALTSLQALSAADFIDNPSAADLEKYGLNPGNPDRVRVELKNKDNETTVVFIGKKDVAPVPPPGPGMPPSTAGKVWVQVEGQPGVIRANAGDLSGLIPTIENPDPLRDRSLFAAGARIDGLDVIVAGQTAKLRKVGANAEWKLYGNPAAGDPTATGDAVKKLLDVITERRTIKGFPPANPAAFAPAEIKAEVKVWTDGFEPATDPKAEPKEKGKPTILLFGKVEGGLVSVRRTLPDGVVAEFLLPDKIKIGSSTESLDLITTVAQKRLGFLDNHLKTFAGTQANRLTVTGVATYDVEKDEKPDPSMRGFRWTFASPADRKGKLADARTIDELLGRIATDLNQVKPPGHFVDEVPSPEKLIEYGLAPPAKPEPNALPTPRLKVAIGLPGTDPKDREVVYEFGKELPPDAALIYARQVGRAAVFTVPRAIYDKLRDADLRDRAIFQFDPTQITKIELKGWGKAGFVLDLNLEKKEGNWVVVKGPEGYALDPAKVNSFLFTLRGTSVKTFVPGAPTEAEGFGSKEKNFLIICLKSGSKEELYLNLGALTDGETAYYGWTSLLPESGRVITVDATLLKQYKESSGAFAK